MKLPQILGKGINTELAKLEGDQRVRLRDHRERLVKAHINKRHREVIEGCPECSLEVGLFLMHLYEPPRDVMEFFR